MRYHGNNMRPDRRTNKQTDSTTGQPKNIQKAFVNTVGWQSHNKIDITVAVDGHVRGFSPGSMMRTVRSSRIVFNDCMQSDATIVDFKFSSMYLQNRV